MSHAITIGEYYTVAKPWLLMNSDHSYHSYWLIVTSQTIIIGETPNS